MTLKCLPVTTELVGSSPMKPHHWMGEMSTGSQAEQRSYLQMITSVRGKISFFPPGKCISTILQGISTILQDIPRHKSSWLAWNQLHVIFFCWILFILFCLWIFWGEVIVLIFNFCWFFFERENTKYCVGGEVRKIWEKLGRGNIIKTFYEKFLSKK